MKIVTFDDFDKVYEKYFFSTNNNLNGLNAIKERMIDIDHVIRTEYSAEVYEIIAKESIIKIYED